MQIDLWDLAQKKVKSTADVTISDHTITVNNVSRDHELIFTGKGARGLVIKNAKGKIIFSGVTIDNASTGVTIKFDGTYDGIKVDGEGTTKLFGKSGNSASQLLYFQGVWSNVEVCGFELDQRRDNKTGSTVTGSALQFAGVLKAGHNLGSVYVHDIVIYNAGDEGNYINHFEKGSGYAQGETLYTRNVKVFGSGRDYFQQWGFKNVTYENCYGENGGKEANPDHCSAFSMNGYSESIVIENCEFKNVAQLIYSGKPESGKTIDAKIYRTRYEQGTHAGNRNNSAAYLKGPGTYHFEECEINAPNVLQAAITADGAQVTYSGCKINAKDIDRLFNGGTVKELPFVRTYPAEVIETTLNGLTTLKLLYNGQEFVI